MVCILLPFIKAWITVGKVAFEQAACQGSSGKSKEALCTFENQKAKEKQSLKNSL